MFAIKRSPVKYVHSRTVYTILGYLGDIGGLSSALSMIIAPFMSFFVPSLMVKSILNNNFKFDDSYEAKN